MIASLSIENFALIEKLDINFSEGFSVITGETGAGKSILLGALGLLMGKRADLSSLKNEQEKCIVEASFSIKKYSIQTLFQDNDIDYEDETIIRREILPSGKSRAFINDTPVTLNVLQEISLHLIDIHSQHQNQELNDENFQIEILDVLANNMALVLEYQSSLEDFNLAKGKLKQLVTQKNSASKEQDYNSFLLEELIAANLIASEQEELEAELEKLSNVEAIKENIEKSIAIATEEQIGVIQNLKEIKAAIAKIAALSNDYAVLFERISSTIIELDDIISELNAEHDKLTHDPERLEFINQKLQLLYSLQKKHQVKTVEELITIKNDLDAQFSSFEDIDNQIEQLTLQVEALKTKTDGIATTISSNRAGVVPSLEDQLIKILAPLGMPNARFKFEINATETYFESGKDEIQLLFSANKGTNFGLLKKIASGGEMSRIMLAVKSILAQTKKLPTIIFDEIDTGISGDVANKMADIMSKMSTDLQLFAITHLPQIASKGKNHYKVFKYIKDENTFTEIKKLDKTERINEIAEMISGKNLTESAITHAKALLS
ncbi:MAG: DNA repair protein RecN [Bacteroidetes bacterium]|nr:DNA repair protein RecN [Bacteroidota bacterium]